MALTAGARSPAGAGLIVTVYLVAFITLIDVNVVVIALPSIQAEFQAATGTLQWIVSAYTLCLSTLSLSAGALGDRYGRKRMFLSGLVLFVAGSAVCAAAPSAGVLIAGRVIQGVAAAVVVPGSLSLLALGFPDEGNRAKAIGGWSTVGGVSSLGGPVLGGLLVDTFGWPSIFLINLPLGVVALVAGLRYLPESADPAHADLDPAGQLLGVLWLGGLSYGLINAGTHGWATPSTVLPLGIAAAGLVLFLFVELRRPHPMLPIRAFAELRFTTPNVAAFALGFTVFSMTIFLPAYLQQAQHHSAAGVGVMMLAPAVVTTVVPLVAGRWVSRTGYRGPMTTGLLVITAGLATMLAVHADSGYPLVAAVLVLLGVGYGLTLPSSNAAMMAATARQRTGSTAATVNAVRQTGTSLGIALLGSLLATQLAHLGGRSYEHAYTDGLHVMAIVAGAVSLGAAALVVATLRGGTPDAETAH